MAHGPGLRRGAGRLGAMLAIVILAALPAAALAAAPPAGPPYPDAVTGQRVYDYAGIFSPAAISEAESIIAGIDVRSGAQVTVYTQVKPASDTLDKANADARSLMDQWGVGRKGIDDGLVILFDMETNLKHGQVSLYAGSGFRAAFLSDADRQAIFNDDMKPLLKWGDLDGGLLAGLRDVDANATPEHRATLEHGRFINSMVALVGLLLGLALLLWAVGHWFRRGRDPVAIDDDSILMPAPPVDLTPAMATILLADRSSDRTVSAGLVDLAAQGCIAFTAHAKAGSDDKTGVKYLSAGDDILPAPEAALRDAIAAKGKRHKGVVAPNSMSHLIHAFYVFKSGLEAEAVAQGWLTTKPGDVILNWGLLGGLEIGLAIVVGFFWFVFGASGIIVAALAVGSAGGATIILANWMPCRTRQGAILWSMLAAYRRTLQLTMAQAASMGDVVKAKALPWVSTPDQVMAWSVAFGLDTELEGVLCRSLTNPDDATNTPASAWHPMWWVDSSTGRPLSGFSLGHAGGSGSSGLFSASALPDPGSMIAALGSISHPTAPASSGGGGAGGAGGGSFGGGGGGGGGGAGGGF
jgi:uncharacterized membrane protein YgcG